MFRVPLQAQVPYTAIPGRTLHRAPCPDFLELCLAPSCRRRWSVAITQGVAVLACRLDLEPHHLAERAQAGLRDDGEPKGDSLANGEGVDIHVELFEFQLFWGSGQFMHRSQR